MHVRGCGGARVAVTDALGGAKGGGRWTALEGGIVTVALQGSCSGCPSSKVTLKSGIENLLVRMVPGVKEVVAEEI